MSETGVVDLISGANTIRLHAIRWFRWKICWKLTVSLSHSFLNYFHKKSFLSQIQRYATMSVAMLCNKYEHGGDILKSENFACSSRSSFYKRSHSVIRRENGITPNASGMNKMNKSRRTNERMNERTNERKNMVFVWMCVVSGTWIKKKAFWT